MTTQPEALRLADELTEAISGYPDPTDLESKAAAELRRLHAENEALRSELRIEQTISFRVQMQQYAAQRDELLEALISLMYWDNGRSEFDRAREVILRVKGGAL